MTTRRRLAQLFRIERAAFARVYPRAAIAELVLDPSQCTSESKCGFRDVAMAMWIEGKWAQVIVLERALSLTENNLIGLIRHELGHICDPTPDLPGREQRADDIAEYVRGVKIRYDKRHVQTIGRGRYPRPRHLHQ